MIGGFQQRFYRRPLLTGFFWSDGYREQFRLRRMGRPLGIKLIPGVRLRSPGNGEKVLLILIVPEPPTIDLQLATRLGFFHEARRLPNRQLPLGMSERMREPQ